jgi:hypothetical protein
MKIYNTTALEIRWALGTSAAAGPPLKKGGSRRPYYSLSLKTGIPAFLDALFALAPAAEVRTAQGRWRGRAEWLAHRRAEAVQAAYEAGGLAQAAAVLRGEGA